MQTVKFWWYIIYVQSNINKHRKSYGCASLFYLLFGTFCCCFALPQWYYYAIIRKQKCKYFVLKTTENVRQIIITTTNKTNANHFFCGLKWQVKRINQEASPTRGRHTMELPLLLNVLNVSHPSAIQYRYQQILVIFALTHIHTHFNTSHNTNWWNRTKPNRTALYLQRLKSKTDWTTHQPFVDWFVQQKMVDQNR